MFKALSKLFSRKKQELATDAVVDEKGSDIRHLTIHVSSIGWHSILLDGEGIVDDKVNEQFFTEKEIDRKQGSSSTLAARLEAILRNAILANKTQLAHADKVSLILGDANVEYSDSKPAELKAPSGTVVRQFGRVRLNETDVTYGKGNFPKLQDNPSESKSTIYAFVGADLLRSLMATFDLHGLKIVEVVPQGYQIISRSFEMPDRPYGAFEFGGLTTTIYLVNPYSGNLMVRTFPVGYLTLVYALVEGSGIPLEEAIAVLGDRDHVHSINPYADLADESVTLTMSEFSQALHPTLKRLLDELRSSLEYFTFQKVSGQPESLEAFGETQRIKGFLDWIGRHCNLQVIQGPSNRQLLETFVTKTRFPRPCNLLSGSETQLLTVGRTSYVYSSERGFVSSHDIIKGKEAEAKLQKNKDAEKKDVKGGRSGLRKSKSTPSGRLKRGEKKRPSRGDSQGSFGQNFVQRITALFQGGGDGNVQAEDNKYFALFSFLALGLIYWGWSMVDSQRTRFNRETAKFLNDREKRDSLIENVNKSGFKGWSMGNTGDMAKILWTEKFILIGDHLNDHIWLSDLYLEKGHGSKKEDDQEKKGDSVETILVLQGNVLPSFDGHIQRISEFLGSMLLDEEGFMSDFDNVTFHGAELVPADNIVQFKLKALYNADKRIKAAKDALGQSSNGKDAPQPGLGDMQKNIRDRERLQEKALRGGR